MEASNSPPEKVPPRLDQETFERIFAQYGGGVRAVLKSKLGNDAEVDDCFSRVFEKLWVQGSQVNPAAIGAWLFVVARREAALHWRKQKSADAMIERVARDVNESDDGPSPVAEMVQLEKLESLRTAIQGLSREHQEVIRMRFMSDQSFREIAETLNVPLGTALTRLHTALKKLRTRLSDPD